MFVKSDVTVTYLMSMVHIDKIWVESAKNFGMRTSGGRGGSQRMRTPPDEGGRGGQKRANFCGRPLWMAPYTIRRVVATIKLAL